MFEITLPLRLYRRLFEDKDDMNDMAKLTIQEGGEISLLLKRGDNVSFARTTVFSDDIRTVATYTDAGSHTAVLAIAKLSAFAKKMGKLADSKKESDVTDDHPVVLKHGGKGVVSVSLAGKASVRLGLGDEFYVPENDPSKKIMPKLPCRIPFNPRDVAPYLDALVDVSDCDYVRFENRDKAVWLLAMSEKDMTGTADIKLCDGDVEGVDEVHSIFSPDVVKDAFKLLPKTGDGAILLGRDMPMIAVVEGEGFESVVAIAPRLPE